MPLNTQIYNSNLDSPRLKNVIFDLGGVIVNIDPELTANAFAELAGTDPVDIMALHQSQTFFTDYEKGLINDAEFRKHLNHFLKKEIPDEVLDKAWGEILMDIPPQKIDMLIEAGEEHRTFLLSNTNHIHTLKFTKTFLETSGREIGSFFEKVYYSFRMGKRKPDADIFEQVLQDNELVPEETLMIDDSLPNIETAKQLGMQTLHVERNQALIEWNPDGRRSQKA